MVREIIDYPKEKDIRIKETDTFFENHNTSYRMFLKIEPEMCNQVFKEIKQFKDSIQKEYLEIELYNQNEFVAATWITKNQYNNLKFE